MRIYPGYEGFVQRGRGLVERARTAEGGSCSTACSSCSASTRTHGYDLVERLRPFGFDGSDPGGTYRALRAMERRDLVTSSWEDSEAGPHRRVYELTDEGRALLDRDAEELGQAHDILFNYLARYHRLVNVQERVAPDSR